MASMKYISDEFGNFIIFSNPLTHKDIADKLGIKPVAAGSVALMDKDINVSGESVTLRCSCDKADGERIKRQLDFYDGA